MVQMAKSSCKNFIGEKLTLFDTSLHSSLQTASAQATYPAAKLLHVTPWTLPDRMDSWNQPQTDSSKHKAFWASSRCKPMHSLSPMPKTYCQEIICDL
jgi:hypothetical protein